ncbi:MAG: aspartate kinase [Candidatus Cloacimonadales bacterium]
MRIIVKKFGGSSVAGTDQMRNIAIRLNQEMEPDCRYVIVVSAMGDTTDKLTQMAQELSKKPCKRELDMLLTAGERISMSLLSIALQEHGIGSISFTGSQSGIITDSHHGNARIIDVTAFRIREELVSHKVVIVAGFQGVSREKEVTTLGRGGSDTSAVALAAYLNAEKCEIFTDVDGIYSADPRIVKSSVKLTEIDYETVLEMAYGGAKVIHPRAIEFAKKYDIPLEIKSSFTFNPGTFIIKETLLMKEKMVTSLSQKTDLYRFVIEGDALKLLNAINKANIEIFDFSINENLILIVEKEYYDDTLASLKSYQVSEVCEVQSISIIGHRVINDIGFLMQLIKDVKSAKTEIKDVKKNAVGITLIIASSEVDELLNKLHKNYIN